MAATARAKARQHPATQPDTAAHTQAHTPAQKPADCCCRSTEEQQRIAYRELYRPGWPATFEQAMQTANWRLAICGLAINRRRIALRDVAKTLTTLPRGLPLPPTPPSEPTHGSRSPYSKATGPQTQLGTWPNRPRVDIKRLAANDKDDDE